MQKILACIIALSIHLLSSAQCFLKEVPIEQRTANSDLIIEGKVISKHSFWNDDHTMIYTSNRVEIFKIFRGISSPGIIDILTVGGIVGDRMIKTNSLLNLDKDETGIFICEKVKHSRALPPATPGIPRYETYASMQGFLKYDLQEKTASDPFKKYNDVKAELYKILSLPGMNYKEIKPFNIGTSQSIVSRTTAVSGFSPATITAGTGSVLTINGSGFGAIRGAGFVEFRNGDDGGATFIQPLASQYVSWSNTVIQVQVPSLAATGVVRVTQGVTFTSASNLTVSYSHLNVEFDPGPGTVAYQTDHVNDNGLGGYTWRMNTAFNANVTARASFMRAFNTWKCSTNINWIIGATTIINDAVSDGTNIICFDNTAPLPPGTLGVCYSYWSGCASGPTIIWYVNELDIIFDEGGNIAPLTWEFGPATPSGSEYDFQTVAVHELGHGHQLGHVISAGAIMHFAISNGASNRSLGANDLAGGNFVQAKSQVTNVCGSGAMAFSGCAGLPLTITNVKAYQKNNGIQVEWVNASESDVQHYEIEESNDGNNFTSAETISARSNNGSSADYDWFDKQVNNLSNYYRIKTVGLDGRTEYSVVVWVKLAKGNQAFSVYPNPVRGNSFTAEMNNLEKGIYTLTLYNVAGQQVLNRKIVHLGGFATENIHLPAMAVGVYRLILKGNNKDIQQTILIER